MMVADQGWHREFDEPILPPDGRKLIGLRDAADYITSLPNTETAPVDWQVAIGALMLVSQNGPTRPAQIAIKRSLNRGWS